MSDSRRVALREKMRDPCDGLGSGVNGSKPSVQNGSIRRGFHCLGAVQGERTTREYDRTITVPNGKKSIEHVIQQLAVELKADTVRIVDRNITSYPVESAQPIPKDDIPQ